MAAADADWANYSTSPILAGLTKIFTAPRETCGSCGRDAAKSAVVTGTNAITPKLRDYVSTGMLEGLDAEYVVRFLKRYLHWGVVDVNKQRHKPESVPGLCVGVSSTLSVLRDGIVTDWEFRNYPEVTAVGTCEEQYWSSCQHSLCCRPRL